MSVVFTGFGIIGELMDIPEWFMFCGIIVSFGGFVFFMKKQYTTLGQKLYFPVVFTKK